MSQADEEGEFALPAWIESSSEYDGRRARARFEARALELAKQAFWLELFSILRSRPEIAGARFTHERKAERMIRMEGAAGASAARVALAQKALSGARGKFTTGQAEEFREHVRAVVAKGALVTLAREEEVLERALGGRWAARRRALREAAELEAGTPLARAAGDGGRL